MTIITPTTADQVRAILAASSVVSPADLDTLWTAAGRPAGVAVVRQVAYAERGTVGRCYDMEHILAIVPAGVYDSEEPDGDVVTATIPEPVVVVWVWDSIDVNDLTVYPVGDIHAAARDLTREMNRQVDHMDIDMLPTAVQNLAAAIRAGVADQTGRTDHATAAAIREVRELEVWRAALTDQGMLSIAALDTYTR